ncbi:hypothetical protein GCM10009676_12240 [Prauserella halophila]|uniref:Mce-associated membrane protein n=1 Tax=Prauserella halophila TaxID=185641 RepID=A0ABP4GMW4_9PSEU|nr:hypothetical protein [Prauserella halophila]MCP2236557.1 hypothetical protein [Prauserella halophila]
MTRRTGREPGDREGEMPGTETDAEPGDDGEDRGGRDRRDAEDEDALDDERAAGQDLATGGRGTADDASAGTKVPATRRATVLAVLAAVCVVATAGAVWLGMRSVDAAPDDVAHVDAARTQQLAEEIDAAVTAVFSYDRGDLARTERAADRVLTGKARREYDATFARLRDGSDSDADGGRGGESGTVQSTTVRSVGVRSLHADRAELLVLADQRVLGEDMRPRSSDAVWIDVEAVRVDGTWRISRMSPT